MVEKTFAGARLRHLRESHSMSQADLARVLEISPSYLNQIEHNSRPLSVSVLLRITEVFGVDAEFFANTDTSRLVADVREALLDRKSTRLNSSHVSISYAVFCLKKKNRIRHQL